ncbi:MAG: NIPSNAP family protein [Chloroflexi bacterium]|nr:NIPSNAP family protein [Chloroflexota bacterium]MDA1271091.1 NIPSNAP family protein [Chloroflexota bacterium]PKB58580.1 MAG: NIPSNAP family containing protein [SAR202 cluster bacterium Casp-Chloro-G2]
MFLELRQYTTNPGQRDNWVQFMEETIIPFQVSKGMVIVGSFRGERERPDATQDENQYVWIRRFESESERERLYKAVYQSDEWVNNIAPRIPAMLDRDKIVVTRIEPTAASVIH